MSMRPWQALVRLTGERAAREALTKDGKKQKKRQTNIEQMIEFVPGAKKNCTTLSWPPQKRLETKEYDYLDTRTRWRGLKCASGNGRAFGNVVC